MASVSTSIRGCFSLFLYDPAHHELDVLPRQALPGRPRFLRAPRAGRRNEIVGKQVRLLLACQTSEPQWHSHTIISYPPSGLQQEAEQEYETIPRWHTATRQARLQVPVVSIQ